METPLPPLAEVSTAALAVLAERQRQITRYGHTADADDAAPRQHLLRLGHVFLLDAADLLSRRPNPAELTRVRRKAVQAAALCLAEIERIDRELAAGAD
ncbi:hypothetical protein [Novosphingobium sp. ST904]|uniref:hypothetical protein n=1 Tax=Novosphingobium sp. ST904 TaxID=1684385 RepID=UPI0006C88F5B|nr:hypothetical protein [Novosphingobium sp. ST904]KPH62307.1 hypothetical protein ADT71_15305 [Novosphingobium sp. ST904]TCM43356.1 hypothetical protein EDF59_101460 [Novosphingobium sp. ST904]